MLVHCKMGISRSSATVSKPAIPSFILSLCIYVYRNLLQKIMCTNAQMEMCARMHVLYKFQSLTCVLYKLCALLIVDILYIALLIVDILYIALLRANIVVIYVGGRVN